MKYLNPVLRGFRPDPSVCRVGEDYYLVVSSFEYMPGIPLFHSRDLVNWTLMNYCARHSEWFPMGQARDSGGIWAPTLRYHGGRFYVTATLDGYGNFIVSAQDPAGAWSPPVWLEMEGIDPSLYFEDGQAYCCTNGSLHAGIEEITMAPVDVTTGRLQAPRRVLWRGTGGCCLEAPHVYCIDGWYYLLAAEGGTFFNHMVTVARSRSLWGPYESCPMNPVLSNRHDATRQVQCTGHGELLQDHHGQWWMMHLGTRLARRTMSHLGRETFLTPVQWHAGWPVAGEARLRVEGPLWQAQEPPADFVADFSKDSWELPWRFLRQPRMEDYQRGKGELTLRPRSTPLTQSQSPTLVAVHQPDFRMQVEAKCRFTPCREGDCGGLVILCAADFWIFFGKERRNGADMLLVRRHADDMELVSACVPASQGEFALRIRSDRERYLFEMEMDGETWQPLGQASTRFLACEVVGRCFTGTVVGLYAGCAKETEARLRVSSFTLHADPEEV